jgi:hypothetical protein
MTKIKDLQTEIAELKSKLDPCWLEKEPFYQCCCNCKLLAKLNLHCQEIVNYNEVKGKHGCVCDIQVAWVCMSHIIERSPEEMKTHPIVQIFRNEHGVGCEMYDPIDTGKGGKPKGSK